MPVWHELTADWRASGDLVVLGIVQEQHPDRARLYAQWQGLDWPILWDPMNLTGSSAVPGVFALDEHGVVRATRPDPRSFEESFLMQAFDAPAGPDSGPPAVRRRLLEEPAPADGESAARAAAARLLWGEAADLDGVIDVLAARAEESGAGASDRFRLGVALARRHEGPAAQPGDFAAAIESWAAALAQDPNQYIWRRRLQQYGPTLDKPYPFYGWIAEATAAVRARGEEPVPVRVPLTGSEVAERARAFHSGAPGEEPDPEGLIARDEEGFLRFEGAVVHDTSPPGRGGRADRRSARVHLRFRPRDEIEAHWNNAVEPARVWIELPAGWRADRVDLVHAPPAGTRLAETSSEPRLFDFEVQAPEDAGEARVEGYILFHACEGVDGRCVYRRRDFSVLVTPPARSSSGH